MLIATATPMPPVERLKVFAYVNESKTSLYRAIIHAFMEAKERFSLHLRPPDLVECLATFGLPEPPDDAAVDAALQQLREWGNLERHPDTADVATVEEFYRPRYLYQLTAKGEAAERAIAHYREAIAQQGELQAAALGDIRRFLEELLAMAEVSEPDDGKVKQTLDTLRTRFEELTSRASAFMRSLQRSIDLHGIALDAFVAYKETLIGYLERFIGELVIATADISDLLTRLDAAGVERLLAAAARRELVDAIGPTDDDRRAALAKWELRWAGLRAWFIGRPSAPSHAEILRARARSSIPALLAAVTGIHDRRMTRSDRSADLRTLARWFAQADTDREAHLLYRAAFALSPARHLSIDHRTLERTPFRRRRAGSKLLPCGFHRASG